MQGVKIMSTKTFLLWIPLLLQVGSFFFGNGTTYSDEVLCETKDHYQLEYHVYHSRQILHKFQLEIVCKKTFSTKTIFPQICDNLTNGTFAEEQEAVQKVMMMLAMLQ